MSAANEIRTLPEALEDSAWISSLPQPYRGNYLRVETSRIFRSLTSTFAILLETHVLDLSGALQNILEPYQTIELLSKAFESFTELKKKKSLLNQNQNLTGLIAREPSLAELSRTLYILVGLRLLDLSEPFQSIFKLS